MNAQTAIDPSTADALDESFKRRARITSRDASNGLLARGRTVSYRERNTPPGHVMRRHPDGRVELVRIDLGHKPVSTDRRPA